MATAMLTTKALSVLVGVGADRLAQLEQAGVVKRAGRNRWPAVNTLAALVRYYRDDQRRTARIEAEAALRTARQHEIEIRTAERLNKLVNVEELKTAWDFVIGKLAGRLGEIPSRVTRDLQLRVAIEAEIDGARNAGAAECDRQAAALRANGKAAPVKW